MAAASQAAAPASGAAGEATVQVKPLQLELPMLAARLSGNPSPDSYAHREDARRLADDIARTRGLDPQWVWEALSRANVKESAARLMMPAPAGFAKNWSAYRSRFVEPLRIKAGVQFWRTHEAELRRAELKYGVPASIIAGVLGVETIYGRNTGSFRVLDVLATLSLDFPKGRSDRSEFFKSELAEYLLLCVEQGLDPEQMQGSYAGAVGLPQFMPSSIRKFAVDFDGDGRVDLQKSAVDAIGSVAHYLAEHGWQADWPAYYSVTPPSDGTALDKLLAPDITPSFSAREMHDLGAVLPAQAHNYPGQLALVQLLNGRALPTHIAGTGNFYTITRYNKSSYYALAVVQLGEAVSREAQRQFGQAE
jgi:membrane-bound lytic murein transglycosylase B